MGICNSCESTSVATAKLISVEGALEEFTVPVKVSHVLRRHPTCFVCNADDMDFGDFVTAAEDGEELRPGQLYFTLPVSWLAQPLQAEDMAALAVKASLALKRSSGGGSSGVKCGGCNRRVDPLVVFEEKETRVMSRRRVLGHSGGELVEERRARRRRDGGRGGEMTRKLSMIVEE